jgi:uncharacterized protein with beta-barrel porin domain
MHNNARSSFCPRPHQRSVGSNSTTSSIYGTAVGADYRISPDTLAGFALAGGGTSFSVAGSGSGHSDLIRHFGWQSSLE